MSERVLIVEDDRELRALLAEELSEQGYEVLSAADAESALAQEEATQLDLVISDLRLPGSDGMALLEHLAKRTRRPAFLMITAFGTTIRPCRPCAPAPTTS